MSDESFEEQLKNCLQVLKGKEGKSIQVGFFYYNEAKKSTLKPITFYCNDSLYDFKFLEGTLKGFDKYSIQLVSKDASFSIPFLSNNNSFMRDIEFDGEILFLNPFVYSLTQISQMYLTSLNKCGLDINLLQEYSIKPKLSDSLIMQTNH